MIQTQGSHLRVRPVDGSRRRLVSRSTVERARRSRARASPGLAGPGCHDRGGGGGLLEAEGRRRPPRDEGRKAARGAQADRRQAGPATAATKARGAQGVEVTLLGAGGVHIGDAKEADRAGGHRDRLSPKACASSTRPTCTAKGGVNNASGQILGAQVSRPRSVNEQEPCDQRQGCHRRSRNLAQALRVRRLRPLGDPRLEGRRQMPTIALQQASWMPASERRRKAR